MSTARSSTRPRDSRRTPRWLDWRPRTVRLGSATQEAVRAARDVRHLLRFRLSGLRGRSRRAVPITLAVLVLVTLLAASLPAFLPELSVTRQDVLILLPTSYIGVLVISLVSAASSGGGRELLPRHQAVAFPVSPTTDHLGALLMAPLNIAWLLQCWTLLAATSYAVGARPLLPVAMAPVFLWLFTGTVDGPVPGLGGGVAAPGPSGSHVVRGTAVAVGGLVALLVVTGRLTPMLDSSPTLRVVLAVLAGAQGDWLPWLAMMNWLLGHRDRRRSWWAPGWPTGWPGGPPTTSCASSPPGTGRGRTPAPTSSPCCAPTGRASGGRCRCAAAWSCSRCSRAWSRSAATSTGPRSRSSPAWSPPAACCCSG